MESATAFDRIPLEVWGQVALALPASSLPSFVQCSRKFHNAANPQLYRTVHFSGTSKSDERYSNYEDSEFGIDQAGSQSGAQSSSIISITSFLKTITAHLDLKSHIVGATFKWDATAAPQDVLDAKRSIEQLKQSPIELHISLPNFDPKFAVTCNVTCLEIQYPDHRLLKNERIGDRYDVDLSKSLRDSVHSLFCIPTLRHLSLKYARTWEAFTPNLPADESRVGTSNLISLYLPNTVPLSRDLEEILTWPKTLKYMHHQQDSGPEARFQDYSTEQVCSPGAFITGIHSQRHSLEGLVYNNCEDRCGVVATSFGTALRGFPQLRRLAVTRDSLAVDGKRYLPPLHQALPPNLEEAWIEVSDMDVYIDEYRLLLREWLLDLAINKDLCSPSLKRLFLWKYGEEYKLHPPDYAAEANKFLDAINLVTLFHEAGVHFDFTYGIPTGFGESHLINLKESWGIL